MRKTIEIITIALLLIAPSLYAQQPESSETAAQTAEVQWTESTEADECRLECAEEGTDPDECQQDCNTVI